MNMIFLGPPGAGKGTQAEKVASSMSLAHISTGDMLRGHMREGTPLGIEAKRYVQSGALVPDEVIIAMVGERVKERDCANGFLLDGFPRTIAQAQALEQLAPIDAVLNIEVPFERLMSRICGRRMCPDCGCAVHVSTHDSGNCPKCGAQLYQRDDDKPETVENRLVVYREKTQPLIDFYREKNLLKDIDGDQDVNAVFQDILSALGAKA